MQTQERLDVALAVASAAEEGRRSSAVAAARREEDLQEKAAFFLFMISALVSVLGVLKVSRVESSI